MVDPLGFGSLRLRFKSGRTHFPALAQFGRALDCRSKCCWFKSGRRDFNLFICHHILFFIKCGVLPKHLYMMKIIVIDSVLFTRTIYCMSCPGGVGAIMWACRARDSGSNPGQGASCSCIVYLSYRPVAQSGRALGF